MHNLYGSAFVCWRSHSTTPVLSTIIHRGFCGSTNKKSSWGNTPGNFLSRNTVIGRGGTIFSAALYNKVIPSFVHDDSKNCEEWDQNGEEDYQDGFDTSRFFVHNFRNQGWIIWVLVVSIIRLNGVNWYERRIYNRWRRVTHVAPCSQRSDPAELIADKASYLLPLSELQGVCFVERCGLTTGHFDASVRSSLE